MLRLQGRLQNDDAPSRFQFLLGERKGAPIQSLHLLCAFNKLVNGRNGETALFGLEVHGDGYLRLQLIDNLPRLSRADGEKSPHRDLEAIDLPNLL